MTAKRSLPQHHETHDNHETQSQKQITIVHDYHKTNSIHHMPLFTRKLQLIQPDLNPKLLHGSQTTGPRNHKTQGCYRIPLFAPACRPVCTQAAQCCCSYVTILQHYSMHLTQVQVQSVHTIHSMPRQCKHSVHPRSIPLRENSCLCPSPTKPKTTTPNCFCTKLA